MLVALLVASTALFAIGVIAERSGADEDREAASIQTTAESAEQHQRGEPGETGEPGAETGEAVLGVDLQSTPLVVLAGIIGLALAVLASTRLGEPAAVLTAIALIALAWAALDVREVLHQIDESRTRVALIAAGVALLHLATAVVAAQLAANARRARAGTPGRAGTMPA